MTARANVMKRLEAVYGLVEQVHSISLRMAAAKVFEAEAAIDAQRVQLRGARTDGHKALSSGDRESWALTELQRKIAAERQDRLEALRAQKEVATNLAKEVYNASRLRREQVKGVLESEARIEQAMERRRMQTAADDRFLSRLRWNRLRFKAV